MQDENFFISEDIKEKADLSSGEEENLTCYFYTQDEKYFECFIDAIEINDKKKYFTILTNTNILSYYLEKKDIFFIVKVDDKEQININITKSTNNLKIKYEGTDIYSISLFIEECNHGI
jgi:hypothetical protein